MVQRPPGGVPSPVTRLVTVSAPAQASVGVLTVSVVLPAWTSMTCGWPASSTSNQVSCCASATNAPLCALSSSSHVTRRSELPLLRSSSSTRFVTGSTQRANSWRSSCFGLERRQAAVERAQEERRLVVDVRRHHRAVDLRRAGQSRVGPRREDRALPGDPRADLERSGGGEVPQQPLADAIEVGALLGPDLDVRRAVPQLDAHARQRRRAVRRAGHVDQRRRADRDSDLDPLRLLQVGGGDAEDVALVVTRRRTAAARRSAPRSCRWRPAAPTPPTARRSSRRRRRDRPTPALS